MNTRVHRYAYLDTAECNQSTTPVDLSSIPGFHEICNEERTSINCIRAGRSIGTGRCFDSVHIFCGGPPLAREHAKLYLFSSTALSKIKQVFGMFLFLRFPYIFLFFWHHFDFDVSRVNQFLAYFYFPTLSGCLVTCHASLLR